MFKKYLAAYIIFKSDIAERLSKIVFRFIHSIGSA